MNITQKQSNDQKYHLFGDPSMYLVDPRNFVELTSITPDTLKALSKVTVNGYVWKEPVNTAWTDFEGGAFMIIRAFPWRILGATLSRTLAIQSYLIHLPLLTFSACSEGKQRQPQSSKSDFFVTIYL